MEPACPRGRGRTCSDFPCPVTFYSLFKFVHSCFSYLTEKHTETEGRRATTRRLCDAHPPLPLPRAAYKQTSGPNYSIPRGLVTSRVDIVGLTHVFVEADGDREVLPGREWGGVFRWEGAAD